MRVLGLVSGWDGCGFDIAMRNIRVRSTLTGTVSVYGEDGTKGRLAAASRRTELEFDGLVEGGSIPEAGETLTYQGRTFLITSATLTAEKGRFQRFAVRLNTATKPKCRDCDGLHAKQENRSKRRTTGDGHERKNGNRGGNAAE